MGCTSSSEASGPGHYNDDAEFNVEADKRRVRLDKATGEAKEGGEPVEKPETDLFEAVDAGAGE